MSKKPQKPPLRIRTNVYIDPDQKAALERLTAETRVPWAEYVREGINLVLEKYKRKTRR
jgi:hypothetical protein